MPPYVGRALSIAWRITYIRDSRFLKGVYKVGRIILNLHIRILIPREVILPIIGNFYMLLHNGSFEHRHGKPHSVGSSPSGQRRKWSYGQRVGMGVTSAFLALTKCLSFLPVQRDTQPPTGRCWTKSLTSWQGQGQHLHISLYQVPQLLWQLPTKHVMSLLHFQIRPPLQQLDPLG